ncbi:MAG: YqgE/AlgH family protein [Myxococcota bacterium]|nr:YqgE/AlgH family protein [Myxococcota bacterium]
MKRSLAPTLMLATPDLDGGWFSRTVILLLRHDETGGYGLVINRPFRRIDCEQVLELMDIPAPLVSPGLLHGGPVTPEQAVVLHRTPDLGEDSEEIFKGLYLATQRESLNRLCHESDESFWIVMGYAGWGPGQLEQEIELGSWFVVPSAGERERILSGDRASLWSDLASGVGLNPDTLPRVDSGDLIQ